MSNKNPFEKAHREKTNLLISIAGPSASGKTYSAILLARGLVGPEGRIALIDTENKRSRHYAGLAGGFDVVDLVPPFSPGRFSELIEQAGAAGYDALIIDSDSHEWEGDGGVTSMAEAIEARTGRPGLHCWAKPKREHKKFVHTILQQKGMHIICCSRAKEKFAQGKDAKGKQAIESVGLVAVQEKDFIYEMDFAVLLQRADHVPTIIKCNGDLRPLIEIDEPIDIETGQILGQWADAGKEIDVAFEALYARACDVANDPAVKFDGWYQGLATNEKAQLRPRLDDLQKIRVEAERLAAMGQPEEQPAEDDRNPLDEPGSPSAFAGAGKPPKSDAVDETQKKPRAPTKPNPEKVLEQYLEELKAAKTQKQYIAIQTDFGPVIKTLDAQYQQTAETMREAQFDRIKAMEPDQGALV